jgi:hypothetical protein
MLTFRVHCDKHGPRRHRRSVRQRTDRERPGSLAADERTQAPTVCAFRKCLAAAQNGSSADSFLPPLRACSRTLLPFLATAVLCRKRWLSLPVWTMWQWCVSRSSNAVVIFASPNTVDHSCDHHAGVLVQAAEQTEQQRPAGLAERQVAQFIDDQVHARQA